MEDTRKPNHFTCTLAEALVWNQAHSLMKTHQTPRGLICNHPEFQNINEFVDFLADNYGQNLAIGCVTPNKASYINTDGLIEELISFDGVRTQSRRLGQYFLGRFGRKISETQCVALLASSSVLFAIIWIALIRAGYEVMLIAPQNSVESTLHLLKLSKAFAICYDQNHESIVSGALIMNRKFQSDSDRLGFYPSISDENCFKIPWTSLHSLIESNLESTQVDYPQFESASLNSIAFYNHSSGTTGLPKLIPQTHNGQVAVLPRIQEDGVKCRRDSTFTTTPLCTGGIADLLRSWSAAAPIWLFPENKAPIMSLSVLTCIRRIDIISLFSTLYPPSRLAYLSCVPFVLESLVQNSEMKERLCRLKAVGVGGASMPQTLGDQIVANEIPLVSRFGSTECGFLLSSQRDCSKDFFWQALRHSRSELLKFEQMSDGNYELIVEKCWPLVSTASHIQRPYRTHDIFTPHKYISSGWNYRGRSDLQLTLRTGKKFDPVPIELELKNHYLIQDVVIIGDNKPFPAAIVFASENSLSLTEEKIHQEIWIHIEGVNKKQPLHAKILLHNVCILESRHSLRIQKNSKGGVIRSEFAKDFEVEISQIYDPKQTKSSGEIHQHLSAKEILRTVQETVVSIMNDGNKMQIFDDLFDAGVDSARSIQIRKVLCEILPPIQRSDVPQNIVYECGTINELAEYFTRTLNSEPQSSKNNIEKMKYQEMKEMVQTGLYNQQKLFLQLLHMNEYMSQTRFNNDTVVVLTGSTGFLGIHVLDKLIKNSKIARIYLLIRRGSEGSYEQQCEESKTRIISALKLYKIDLNEDFEQKVSYVPFKLKEINLGIPDQVYCRIISEVTHIIHAAWEVNFNLSLKSFTTQINGTINLYNLAVLAGLNTGSQSRNPSFYFCSSVASVANLKDKDMLSSDPANAVDLGYSQSKWVSEAILTKLQEKNPTISVIFLRVGQLSGDTLHGLWNPREAWPLMIDASLTESPEQNLIIKFPDLASLGLPFIDWLPVDYAASAICEQLSITEDLKPKVLQISNKEKSWQISWLRLQDWTCKWAKSKAIDLTLVEPQIWLDELEQGNHRAKALIPLWRTNWKMTSDITETSVEENEDSDQMVLSREYIWSLLNNIIERKKIMS